MGDPVSTALYVHIPFCERRCGYCSFAVSTSPNRALWERYVRAVILELDRWQGQFSVGSIFFGGGTPSLLSAELLGTLVRAIEERFDVDDGIERCIEAHPSTLLDADAKDKLAGFIRLGFNRLSLGIESFCPSTLENLRRRYKPQDVAALTELAREAGFANMNFDLIFGWPWESERDFEESLETTTTLAPEHISIYPLAIEELTPFEKLGVRVDPDQQARLYLSAHDYLERMGWEHYEIANFCRPGNRSKHNMRYWRYDDYLGVGLGAASKIGNLAFTNGRGMSPYLAAAQSRLNPAVETIDLNAAEIWRRRTILGLRLKEGVCVAALGGLRSHPTVEHFWNSGRLVEQDGRACLTP